MKDEEWKPIESAPANIVIMTKIDDEDGVRNEQPLERRGRLWWTVDEAMYVYYVPTHWKYLPRSGKP